MSASTAAARETSRRERIESSIRGRRTANLSQRRRSRGTDVPQHDRHERLRLSRRGGHRIERDVIDGLYRGTRLVESVQADVAERANEDSGDDRAGRVVSE